MRPSSLGGGRILRRTLSVCPSVPLSDEVEVFYVTVEPSFRANIQNRKTSVFAYGPASCMYFSVRAEGRISYGHLGRTNSCFICFVILFYSSWLKLNVHLPYLRPIRSLNRLTGVVVDSSAVGDTMVRSQPSPRSASRRICIDIIP